MQPPWIDLALQQDSVLGRRQAMALGMSEDLWQWKLDRGIWRPVLPGVVTLHSGEPTMRQLLRTGVVKAGRDATLTGDAVLLEHGFPFKDISSVDVAVARTAPKAFRLREGLTYRPHSVYGLKGKRVEGAALAQMTLPFATLYAAAWAPSARAAEWRLATVVQRGLAEPAALRAALATVPCLERHRLILTALDDVEQGAHASSELDFLRVCRRHGLPEPDELQVRVRTGRGTRYLDWRYRKQRVRGEVDGAHHRYVETWEADLLRGNDLAVARRGSDEIELRFTGSQVRHEGWLVAKQLRAALGA